MSSNTLIARRRFLQRFAISSLGASALATQSRFGLIQGALASTRTPFAGGARSLVCVFLSGGNDIYNTIIPTGADAYAQYQGIRGGLSISDRELLPLSNTDYGFHPAMAGMQSLFDSGRLAIVGDVGTLFEPTTRESYQTGTALVPPDLFSHNDQQEIWQTARPPIEGITQPGWGGRMADLLADANSNPLVPPALTLAGNNNFQAGESQLPFSLDPANGVEPFLYLSGNAFPPSEPGRSAAWQQLLVETYGNALERTGAAGLESARVQIDLFGEALALAPPITTEYPGSRIAQQLAMAARVISVREALGMQRQLFFVEYGSFDFHGNQLGEQAERLRELSDGLAAFQANMDELGLADSVTAFTASDFGRTLTVNGDGTDHGWSSAAFVLGGAVNGGVIHGGLPSLEIGGPTDTDDAGRMIPAYSLDQYGATLARWMGIGEADLDEIFPYLRNFESRDLGFMNA
ncbi:MAG: DUF1501 domain-containing protein [Pseudomonadota bacterium]